MKKFLKRLVTLSLALVIVFSALSTTALAAVFPEPYLLYYDFNENTYVYSYQPEAYHLTSGVTAQLKNTGYDDGGWIVPAYQRITINYKLYNKSSVKVTVIKSNGSNTEIVFNGVMDSSYGSAVSFINNDSTPATYRVYVSGQTGDAYLTSYIVNIK